VGRGRRRAGALHNAEEKVRPQRDSPGQKRGALQRTQVQTNQANKTRYNRFIGSLGNSAPANPQKPAKRRKNGLAGGAVHAGLMCHAAKKSGSEVKKTQPWTGFGSTWRGANLVGYGWANFHSVKTHFLDHFGIRI